ncbi:MAG: RidA family protein [Candidatus Dormibacteraeota bacterium]|nr:RidA family protein [Candidatus Dormibacteraeota bacterium]
MDRSIESPHQLINPETLAAPSGFSHAVLAQSGRTVYIAGQTATGSDGRIVGETMASQFAQAAANVVTALESAGAQPQHLVSMQIFVTSIDEYRQAQREIGEAYRRHFGRHYPAMALLEVQRLFDVAAKVELMCIAVTVGNRKQDPG